MHHLWRYGRTAIQALCLLAVLGLGTQDTRISSKEVFLQIISKWPESVREDLWYQVHNQRGDEGPATVSTLDEGRCVLYFNNEGLFRFTASHDPLQHRACYIAIGPERSMIMLYTICPGLNGEEWSAIVEPLLPSKECDTQTSPQ